MNANLGRINFVWNIIVTASTSFMAFFIPLDNVFNLRTNQTYILINVIITTVFILDIFFSFYRNKVLQSEFIFEAESGVKLYLKKWFIFDFLAIIPVSYFVHPSLLQLIRLFKLVKIAHLMRNLRQKEVQYANTLTIIFFLFWISHFAHWLACGWLSLIGFDTSMSEFENYIRALYWTVTTITTVGYGDITPATSGQIIYAMFVEVLGVGVYGYLIGKISSFLAKKDPAKTRYTNSMENLTSMTKMRKLPIDLQEKLRNYYTYMFKQRRGFDESKFLEGLPDGLKREVSIFLKKEIIEKIPLFKDSDERFLHDVALHLTPTVFTPGDYVIMEGEEGDKMFFVLKGKLEVLIGMEEKRVSMFKDGDFFGEIALFSNTPRTASVKALEYCDLYSLSKVHFDYVLSKYPKIKDVIKEKAEFRTRSKTSNKNDDKN